MLQTRHLMIAMMLVTCSPAIGQDASQEAEGATEAKQAIQVDVGSVRPRIVLEEAPTTIKEAMERHQQQISAADKALAECIAQHEKRKSEVTAVAVGHLSQIAKRHVATGELPAASNVWMEVLRLDAENEDAVAFFRTIGRLDVVQKQLAVANKDDRRVWRSLGSRKPRFVMQRDGKWIEFVGDTRYEHEETGRTEDVIFLTHDNGTEVRIHRDFVYHHGTSDGENVWKCLDGRGSWD